ncbi:hypothetical protein O7602_19465 [Micromonospora sp. WMMD1128]|uniref:hypothetical protein n=1 Tax=unclassified Micromonospora TaxID=2617518 RepID=UPI00248C572A|nr:MULTISPECIES: hypothetical protein [unclassified Micromonospora]WBB71908.1 hypothetical protein O7602_19465 [Micromonospora sp. WMMD1128]WFE34646.1 hypothetical protein O7613_04465 [Micromonospora sp. WMMD975]
MRTKLPVAVLAVSLGVLAGCAALPRKAEPAGRPEVATLESSSAAAPAATAPAPVAPVIRPDTTTEEQNRMNQPWLQCLKKEGVPTRTTADGLLDLAGGDTNETNGRILANEPRYVQACGKLRPVLAPELDEDKNPYWADDNENYHRCVVANGKPLVKKDGRWVPGPGFNDWAPNEAMELECQAKSFDGRKG